jgi:hypothetical protein
MPIASHLLEKLTLRILREANNLHSYYMRDSSTVDRELRSVVIKNMKQEVKLEKDQIEVFRHLDQLLHEGDAWTPIASPHGGVKIEAQFPESQEIQQTVHGRANATVDCTAYEAAAWFFNHCSRERMDICKEEEKQERREVSKEKERVNEKLVAEICNLPFPLGLTQFVSRLIWKQNEDGSISVAVYSAPEDFENAGYPLDYAQRGLRNGVFTAVDIASVGEVPQSKIELHQSFSTDLPVPTEMLRMIVLSSLRCIADISKSFKRDDSIDRAALAQLANIISTTPQHYSKEEVAAIESSKDLHTKGKGLTGLKLIDILDPFVDTKMVHQPGANLATCVGKAIIDTCVEESAAYAFYHIYSRKTKRTSSENGYTQYEIENINDHSLHFFATKDYGFSDFGFEPRQERSKVTWAKKPGGKIYISTSDFKGLQEKYPINPSSRLISTHSVWEFKPLPPKRGVQQTEVSLTKVVDLMGVVTSSVMGVIGPELLVELSHLRKNFDKSREMDAMYQTQLMSSMTGLGGGSNDFDTKFQMPKNAIQTKGLSSVGFMWVDLQAGSHVWGKSLIMVKASLEETMAFLWDIESRANCRSGSHIQRFVSESKGDFDVLVTTKERIQRKGQGPLYKETPSNMRMFRTMKGELGITLTSNEFRGIEKKGLGQMISARISKLTSMLKETSQVNEAINIKATMLEKKKTKLEFVSNVQIEGRPTKAAKLLAIKNSLRQSVDTAFYFSNLLSKSKATDEDGLLFAEKFLDELRNSKTTKVEAVNTFIESNTALKELAQEFLFIEPMLCALVMNNLHSIERVETKAECTGRSGGRSIGRSLAISLATNLTASAGVDEWIHQFPALQEVDKRNEWFRPMIETIGFQLVR